jgi:ferric-dicitrate binding protein FerR (iron transport regulator)
MADITRIAQLIVRQLRGALNAEEKEELDAWVRAFPENRQFMETRMSRERLAKSQRALREMDGKAIDRKLQHLLNKSSQPAPARHPTRIIRIKKWSRRIAAVLFTALIVGGIIDIFTSPGTALTFSAFRSILPANQWNQVERKDSVPTLTLSDNTRIDLSSITKEIRDPLTGCRIKKSKDSLLYLPPKPMSYFLPSPEHAPGNYAPTQKTPICRPLYNTVFNPKGSPPLEIYLPDGSKARLSPGSSLSYPLDLLHLPVLQNVLLASGEVAFETLQDPQIPFIVETKRTEVSVLGTTFTVRDYEGEDSSCITLFTGQVKVRDGWNTKDLSPGQTATITVDIDNACPDLRVRSDHNILNNSPFDPGVFDFTNRNLHDAMLEVAARYKIDHVVIDQGIDTISPGKLGTGPLPKDIPLSELLSILETDHLHFIVKDRTIYVNP